MRRLLHVVECLESGVEFLLNDLSGGAEDFGERVALFRLILQEGLQVSFDAEQRAVKLRELCLFLWEVFGLDDGGGCQEPLEPFALPSVGHLPVFGLLLLVGVLDFTASFEAGSLDDVHVVLEASVPVVHEDVKRVVRIKHLRVGVVIQEFLANLADHQPRVSIAVHAEQGRLGVRFRPGSQHVADLYGLLCGEHLVCRDLCCQFVWGVQ